MASLVLTIGGSALGNALLPGIGGALLGGIGAYVGGQIDNAVFGSSHIKGPRLENLKIQDSTYGKSIPVVYGNARIAGNVIWTSDLIETLSSDQVGGKGGSTSASVQRASYSVDCAIAIGMGMAGASIGNIRTIWADSKIIYSDGRWNANVIADAEFYTGTETQNPSPLMEGYLGVGNVPAYRGVAYAVFHRLQLANFGNRLPNMTFECYPADASVAPRFLGATNSALLSRPQTAASYNAMPAIPLARAGSSITRMVMGGVIQTGTSFQFAAVEMDLTGNVPVEINRSLSASITRSSDMVDVSWALSPDGTSIAFYMQHSDAFNPATIAIYKIASRSFGTLLSDNLGYSSALNQIAWLDEQRFVLQDVVSGECGVRVYAMAGTAVVSLGFFGVWGVGSSATRYPLPFAQFCKLSGGLCFLMGDVAVTPTSLYTRTLAWQNNGLVVGSEILLSNTLAGFSSINCALLPLSANEFVLARLGTSDIRLLSFTANFNTSIVTRGWTSIAISPSGDLSISIRDGRICFLHEAFSTVSYRYGEIAVTATGFSLTTASTLVTGSYSGTLNNFSLYPVDATRFVVQATGGSGIISRIALIERAAAEQNLSAIVADILTRAGYVGSDYDVSALGNSSVQGYVVDDVSSARAALEPLQAYQPFDLIETDGILKAKIYSAAINITVPESEVRASPEKQDQPPALQTTRGQELDLPREVSVDYLDPALDFQRGSQRARRIASNAMAVETMRLPVVCPAQKAKQIAESQLYRRWAERSEHELYINRNYAPLDTGDVISFSGQALRITHINQQGGVLKTQAVPISDLVLNSSAIADGGKGVSRDMLSLISSTLCLIDAGLLQAEDDQPGFYVAMSGSAAWPGASLMRSTDGSNYAVQDSFSLPATIGLATTVLPPRPVHYMDRASTVTVALLRGNLSSCSSADLFNGSNAALLGDEIIQFQNANLNADGTVTLSNLLRGRKGSEGATSTHITGERFVLLQPATVHFLPLNSSDRGRTFYYRAASIGQDVHDVADTVFVPQINNLKPLAPCHVTANRNSSLDITLAWKRRARSNSEWIDLIDVPLDETSELYDVEIMNGSTVVRSFLNQPSPMLTYTAAQQIADFGAAQSTVTINIYQLSARFGRGNPAIATV
ncbi:MAG: phage tail protein [Alphaproteobacteria bacterium]|nr:phage tail protein [Alphaproteobacteria bacterium]